MPDKIKLGQIYWEIQKALTGKTEFKKGDKLIPVSLFWNGDILDIYTEGLTEAQLKKIDKVVKVKHVIHNRETLKPEIPEFIELKSKSGKVYKVYVDDSSGTPSLKVESAKEIKTEEKTIEKVLEKSEKTVKSVERTLNEL